MLKKLGNAFLNLIYPRSCLHCETSAMDEGHLLCEGCAQVLEPMDKEGRCNVCFSTCSFSGICNTCSASKPPFLSAAAVFEYSGPAASLIKHLKYGRQAYLAEVMGAYLAAQLVSLDWRMPDCIVPVPMAASHYFVRGFNQSELLARAAANILDRPVVLALGRFSGDFSQAGLSRQQRALMDRNRIQLLKRDELYGKHILLVDDVYTTGKTLSCCAESLQKGSPASVYGLTFCMAN